MFIDIMIVYLAVAFLIGGIPFGFIIGKLFGHIDLRKQGSGNIGATNVGRLMGLKYAILTFILDGLKSFLPVLLAKKMFGMDFAMGVAFFVVNGHIFSIWLRGKGGKGVSSIVLAMLALDYRLFLIIAITWVVCFKFTKISALAALISVTVTTVSSYFILNKFCFCTLLLLSLSIFFAHRANLKRMFSGRELGFGDSR